VPAFAPLEITLVMPQSSASFRFFAATSAR
jgi:hypothetical protein